ncbi:MAG: hypothetical protein K2M76_07435, partial [Muribaculaceae bacterium]|nr:hypothetical protein [Muribaculaceae bacterium]
MASDTVNANAAYAVGLIHRIFFVIWCVIAPCVASGATSPEFLKQLPERSYECPGCWLIDSVEARLDALPLRGAEGLWQMTGDGAIVAVVPVDRPMVPTGSCMIVMVEAPARHPRPGMLVGYIVPTAKKGVYEMSMYTRLRSDLTLDRPRSFVMTVSSDENRFA